MERLYQGLNFTRIILHSVRAISKSCCITSNPDSTPLPSIPLLRPCLSPLYYRNVIAGLSPQSLLLNCPHVPIHNLPLLQDILFNEQKMAFANCVYLMKKDSMSSYLHPKMGFDIQGSTLVWNILSSL